MPRGEPVVEVAEGAGGVGGHVVVDEIEHRETERDGGGAGACPGRRGGVVEEEGGEEVVDVALETGLGFGGGGGGVHGGREEKKVF